MWMRMLRDPNIRFLVRHIARTVANDLVGTCRGKRCFRFPFYGAYQLDCREPGEPGKARAKLIAANLCYACATDVVARRSDPPLIVVFVLPMPRSFL